jgi:hypothetical protein
LSETALALVIITETDFGFRGGITPVGTVSFGVVTGEGGRDDGNTLTAGVGIDTDDVGSTIVPTDRSFTGLSRRTGTIRETTSYTTAGSGVTGSGDRITTGVGARSIGTSFGGAGVVGDTGLSGDSDLDRLLTNGNTRGRKALQTKG